VARPETEADNLIEGYVGDGLAAGEHAAREMVRSIEAQALAQAERFRGHTR
jgi:hypothetical protein